MPNQVFPASQGSLAGHRERYQFQADIVAAAGEEFHFLALPASDDTTTWSDVSRNGETITLGQSFQLYATSPQTKGYGMDVAVDGSIRETAVISDADKYSFGDGSADYPFSVVALIKPSAADLGGATLLSKWAAGPTAYREWNVDIESNGYPRIRTFDESEDAYRGREDQTPLTAATWTLLVFSYDGRAAVAGFDIYKDGVEVDDANVTSGSYTAMENSTAKVYIGTEIQTSGARINRYAGSIGFIGLLPKDLHLDEVVAIKNVVNAYFKETL